MNLPLTHLVAALLCVGCGLDRSAISLGERDASVSDAAIRLDAPPVDAPPVDAPPIDAPFDAPLDAFRPDAGPEDAGTDAGPEDAGTDAGTDAFVPECDPGDRRCAGAAIEECVDGRYAFRETCQIGCDDTPVRCVTYQPANVALSFRPPGGGSAEVDGEAWDTNACVGIPHPSSVEPQTDGGVDACVVRFDSVSIVNLIVTGSRPLILLVDGDARITGSVDLTAMTVPSTRNGTAGSNADFSDSGGGGGGHCGDGGSGGFGGEADGDFGERVAGGAGGSAATGAFLLTPLSGGGSGLPGGTGSATGGRGGGAFQLSVQGRLILSGLIEAYGQGGGGGLTGDNWSAGGGAGAGGGVLLEAGVEVDAAAGTVLAGGGGGGSASACDFPGRDGAAGDVVDGPAAGGAARMERCFGGNLYSAAGGVGGWTAAPAGVDGAGNGTDGANGGGGGGGAGCLVIRASAHSAPMHNAVLRTSSITRL